MIVGAVQFALDMSANASLSGSTGIAPLACQKSPRNTTPAFCAVASACTRRNTSLHVSIVRLLTCKSLKTIQRSTLSCAGDSFDARSTLAGPVDVGVSLSTALIGAARTMRGSMGSFRARPTARAVPTTERARTFAFPPKATFETLARLNAPRASATSASTPATSRAHISPRVERCRATVLATVRRMLTLRAHGLDYSKPVPSRRRQRIARARASVRRASTSPTMPSTPHARVRVASEELRAEVDALRAYLEPAVEPRERLGDVASSAMTARRVDDRASTASTTRVRALERELARARQEREESEAFWKSTLERERTELRTLRESAEARARGAIEELREVLEDKLRLESACEALVAEMEADRERAAARRLADAAEQEAWDAATRFDETRTMHTALVGWIEGTSFSIRMRGIERRAIERRTREAMAAWRDAARWSKETREMRRRADARLLDRVLVHWSLSVEVRRSGDGSVLRRALSRWRRATRDGADRDVASTGEKAVAALARARGRRALHVAFLSWALRVSNARSARAFAMELLASERVEDDSALSRLKARRRGG